MSGLELLAIILGLITAALSLATAYLNFRTAQQMVKQQNRKQRRLPWK